MGRGNSSKFSRNILSPKQDISPTMNNSHPEQGWKIKQDLCSNEVPTTWNVTSAPGPRDVTVPMAAKPRHRGIRNGISTSGSFGKAARGKRGVERRDQQGNGVPVLEDCHGNCQSQLKGHLGISGKIMSGKDRER